MNEWRSIAFPAISTGNFKVPVDICAQAFFRSITHFWDARNDCVVEKIILCLTKKNFQPFFDAFREDSIDMDKPPTQSKTAAEEPVGYVEINDEDLANLDDDEIDDWFK